MTTEPFHLFDCSRESDGVVTLVVVQAYENVSGIRDTVGSQGVRRLPLVPN
ncbi:hypothetical protein ACFYVR_14325 [Rhodococcus sp. NPDC003318]|uniref:hypothetical protein n=1 Tax=Rhodococcus sp. NPDC003318 TaxID=3364503 RepID=UPI0036BFB2E5